MLSHLFSCGIGSAACKAIVEDCPHRCRVHPLLEQKKVAHCSHRVGDQGDEMGMTPAGLRLARGGFPQRGKAPDKGELRSWGNSHLWLQLHESINKAQLGCQEQLLECKRLVEQISW